MGAVTGIVAGIVTAAGAVAVYRYAQRRARDLRDRIDLFRARGGEGETVIDLELDPSTGVYRVK